MNEKEITIEGMHCAHCAKRVEDAIKKLPNVKKVKVDITTKSAKITSKTEIDELELKNLITELGYKVK